MNSSFNAVEKSLEIIEAFAEVKKEQSISEISKKTGFNKSTIIRLMISLEKYNYISKVGKNRYSLGSNFLRFSKIYRGNFNILEVALPYIKSLVSKTNLSAGLFIKVGDSSRLCILKENPKTPLVSSTEVGDIKSISDDGVSSYIFRAFEKKNLSNMKLQSIRNDFFVVKIRKDRHSAIAAPIFDLNNEVNYSLSLVGDKDILHKQIKNLSKEILITADIISNLNGGNRSKVTF